MFRKVKINLFIDYLHAKFEFGCFRIGSYNKRILIFDSIGTICKPFSTIVNPIEVLLIGYLDSVGCYYHDLMKL